MANQMEYLERFPYSQQEKKLSKTKVAAIEDIENLAFELDKLFENCGDDAIKSDGMSFVREICKERDICTTCYTKIDEVWLDEGYFKHCNCKSNCIVRNKAV